MQPLATITSSRTSTTRSSRRKTPSPLIHGKHTINLGFEFFNYRTNIIYVGNAGLAGQFTYDGSFTSNPSATGTPTGFAEADFLLGLPQNVAIGNGGGRSLRNSLYSAFAQDDWHLRPNLTLNLGLRYEVTTPRGEAHNQATNYNLQTGAVEIAGLNGNSSALYNQYNGPTNFQPRVGFSWQPEFAKATVVRGAYGISNFTESTGTGNLLFQNPPFAIQPNVTYAGGTQALPSTTSIRDSPASLPQVAPSPQRSHNPRSASPEPAFTPSIPTTSVLQSRSSTTSSSSISSATLPHSRSAT